MEQRYEIHEQLGKGGLGVVYRAYDQHLKRDVAIKRILAGANDEDKDAALKHLAEDAAALCALHHPNIVTIFDVGYDEDSPFVVMELLTGSNLEELITQGPLTWDDFHQFAPQTQEALIAAQDRQFVHRDIKPGNVMLSWLPSGKFQVKLVDFGLAKFSPKPTLQEIGKDDSVYGSIFFMAPEQFERKPLDARTDMYAMGCVYYYALTSQYPFTGTTGQEVMAAHLEHRVQPLHEQRPDIPRWVADWVMWHMNRNVEDRPENAREALQQFIMNDQSSNQQNESASSAPHRPKLIIPGAQPAAPAEAPDSVPAQQTAAQQTAAQQTAAQQAAAQQAAAQQAAAQQAAAQQAAVQPVAPPAPAPVQPAAPAQPAPIQPTASVPPAPPVQPASIAPAPSPSRETTPQPLHPPVGSKPSVHDAARKATASVAAARRATAAVAAVPSANISAEPAVVPLAPAAPQGTPVLAGQPPQQAPGQAQAPVLGQGLTQGTVVGATAPGKKKKISNGAMVAIAAVLGLLVVGLGVMMINRMKENKRTEIYNALVVQAKDPTIKKIPVNKEQLDILLDSASSIAFQSQRETIYQCLLLAESNDGTDIDKEIAERATTPLMDSSIRIKLFKVLERRGNAEVLPILLSFAKKSNQIAEVAAALETCKKMASTDDFNSFLDVLENAENTNVQKAAETTIAQIIDRAQNREKLATMLVSAYGRQIDEKHRLAILRLLGHAGGELAKPIVQKALASDNVNEQIAAIFAAGAWPDDSMFESLMDFLADCKSPDVRRRAFDAARRFLSNPEQTRDPEDSEDLWKMFARNAKTDGEQRAVIDGVARQEGDWVIAIIEYFANESDNDRVIDRAERALDHIREREQIEKKDDE